MIELTIILFAIGLFSILPIITIILELIRKNNEIHPIHLILLLVLSLLVGTACSSTATQSSTGECIDDTVITARVKTAIFNDA